MELVHYLRIVRRRWRLVAVFVVLGVLAGTGTLFFRSGRNPAATFYLAKHTLSSTDSSANLARDAQLCTDGEIVAKRVAPKVGFGEPTELNAKVVCEPHAETGLLYVAAVDGNPRNAIALADAWASELVAYLRETAETQTQDKLARLRAQAADKSVQLQDKVNQLNAEQDPTQQAILTQQRDDLQLQLTQLNTQISQAESTQTPADSLTTLSTADSSDAFPISANALETLMAGSSGTRTGVGNSPTQNAARQSQIDLAVKSDTSYPAPTRAAFGGLLGLLLGATVVIVLDRVDPRIRTKFEAEEAFGWPVIGEIPPLSRLERSERTVFAVDEPRSRTAEAYRVLRSALLFVQTGGSGDPDEHPIFSGDVAPADETEGPTRGQVIMLTSPGPSEGKTTTAANLAAILGETGRSVLVVNCDFRRPRIHEHLGAENVPRKVVETRIPNVKLVTQVLDNADDANPALVVQTQRQVIRNAREMFDIILLDTAPLLTTNDATEVLSVADQVAIIAKTGKTHKEAADRAAELLERRGAPVIGIVLVGATDVPTSRYYYYGAADQAPVGDDRPPAPAGPRHAPSPPSARPADDLDGDPSTDDGPSSTTDPGPDRSEPVSAASAGPSAGGSGTTTGTPTDGDDLPAGSRSDVAPDASPDSSSAGDLAGVGDGAAPATTRASSRTTGRGPTAARSPRSSSRR